MTRFLRLLAAAALIVAACGIGAKAQTPDATPATKEQAVAMVQKAYFSNEIAGGQLAAPFDTVLKRDRGYYLTVARERRNAEHVAIFRDWLLAQLAEQGSGDEPDYPVLRVANG